MAVISKNRLGFCAWWSTQVVDSHGAVFLPSNHQIFCGVQCRDHLMISEDWLLDCLLLDVKNFQLVVQTTRHKGLGWDPFHWLGTMCGLKCRSRVYCRHPGLLPLVLDHIFITLPLWRIHIPKQDISTVGTCRRNHFQSHRILCQTSDPFSRVKCRVLSSSHDTQGFSVTAEVAKSKCRVWHLRSRYNYVGVEDVWLKKQTISYRCFGVQVDRQKLGVFAVKNFEVAVH